MVVQCHFAGELYKDMNLAFELENKFCEDQPNSEYTIETGLTMSSHQEESVSTEMKLEISAKFSAGVEGIASSEAGLKFSTTLGKTKTFSSSSMSERKTTLKVPFRVPAKMTTQVWQLVVTDNPEGQDKSTFRIQTEHWQLTYIPIEEARFGYCPSGWSE